MDHLCFSVLCLLCIRMHLFICALWSSAGKRLTSRLSLWCLAVSLLLSHWYPGSGVVLDCIDSCSLHPYLLCIIIAGPTQHCRNNTINNKEILQCCFDLAYFHAPFLGISFKSFIDGKTYCTKCLLEQLALCMSL